jgi:hypothetical protein
MKTKKKGYIEIHQESNFYICEQKNKVEFQVIISKKYKITTGQADCNTMKHRNISEQKTISELLEFLRTYDYRLVLEVLHQYLRK